MRDKLEILFATDCFYRNMAHSDYVAVLDIKHTIVPKGKYDNMHFLSYIESSEPGENEEGMEQNLIHCFTDNKFNYFPQQGI